MSQPSRYRRIIAGDTGPWGAPVRAVLRVLEAVYAGGVAWRNRRYDRAGPRTVLAVPVISVGNITAGGTGKTPFVIEVVRRLEGVGRNPAVISRGYKAVDGEPNDEERLIRKHCPHVVCLSDPDRGRAAETACQRFGADVIVLDDAFQHRRLGRTVDIVVIDATCPFGYGHLLPRGLLREPVRGLQRADVVVITRCDQVSRTELSRLAARLRRLADRAIQLRCNHRVTAIERLDGTPVNEPLAGKRAVLFAAIGHPGAFVTTVQSLGVDVVGTRWWPDHHHYRMADINALQKTGAWPPYDLLITTEKDAIKLAEWERGESPSIVVVRVAIDFVDDGGTILQKLLEEMLGDG